MNRLVDAVARIAVRLDALPSDEVSQVAASSWSGPAERALAASTLTRARHEQRLDAGELMWMAGLLRAWSSSSLAERIVFWLVLAEVTDR